MLSVAKGKVQAKCFDRHVVGELVCLNMPILPLGGATYNGGKAGGGGAAAAKPASAPAPAAKAPAARAPAAAPSSNISVASKATAKPAGPAPAACAAEQENGYSTNNNRNVGGDAQKEIATLRQANQEATRQYAELRTEMEGLEKERDFYFEKLRDIEIVLQDLEDKGEGSSMSASLFKILYATADGFEPSPNAAGPAKSVDVYPESSSYDDVQESY
jgi:RP/EB family microtubule-associated protein